MSLAKYKQKRDFTARLSRSQVKVKHRINLLSLFNGIRHHTCIMILDWKWMAF